MQALRRTVLTALAASVVTGFCLAPVLAGELDAISGWTLEAGVEVPSYALIEPRSRNLNLDVVVLACEQAADRRVPQLQLYLTNDGPLLPDGAEAGRAKAYPRAEIVIDGHIYPVGMLFAEDHVVLSDETQAMFPRVSERLLDAIEQGATMRLRFDLVAEPPGTPPTFDGEAMVELQDGSAGRGDGAIAAVRHCVTDPAAQNVALAIPNR